MSYRASVVGPAAPVHVFRFTAVILLFVIMLFLPGCGGGSSSTTTTGAAPAFTSTAPTIADEGNLYTYNITTTTTDSSTVTYALTTGPTGAAISGSTLTWTPTHAESRTSNSFEITATTSNNGTATQSFTITPNGTINGTVVDHAVTTGGIVDVPENLSAISVEVLISNNSGGYNTMKGSSNSSGNFAITNVPPGSFWLHLPRVTNGVVTDTYIWTNGSDIDAGGLVLGRQDAVPGSGITVNASGITATPGATDTVEWNSPDARAYGFPTGPVTNPYAASFPQTGNLINSGEGDRAYLLHYKNLGSGVSAILENIEYTNITETNGTAVNISGSMKAVSGATTDPNIKITQFDALYSGLPHNSTVTKTFSFNDTGYKGTEGFVPAVNLISAQLSSTTTDTDLGSISYGIVTPAGTPYFEFDDYGTQSFTVNGTNFSFPVGSSLTSNTIPASSSPIVPLIGEPISPLINGKDFFTTQTTTSTSPQISWSGASLGTATAYHLQVTDVSDSFTTQPQTWLFYTTANSVTVPAGVLQSGKTYVFTLTAAADATTQTAPYRLGGQSSYAYVSSALITIGSGSATPVKQSRVAQTSSTVHATYGIDGRLHFQRH